MLRIENLTKIYGDKKAVDDLSLHINAGEIYGFIGHNGAGKTTTLKSVVGILKFDEGKIFVDGESVLKNPIECKKKIAYIPDNPDIYEFMTGIKYLNFIADIFKVDADTRQERIRKYADIFEITDEYDDTSVRKKIIDMCDAMNIDVSGPDGSLTLTTRATGANQKISVRSAGANDETVIYGKDAKITLGTQFTPADGFSYKANGAGIVIIGNDGFEMQIDVTDAKAGDSGIVRVEDAGYMVLQIGANEHQTLEMDFKEVSCQSLFLRNKEGVNQINACTQEGATELLKVLDDAIDKISAARSTLGAYQNRLDATRESLDVSEENLTDAMSRIMDTDMASEMTEYTSNNVLSQAATSMLSQANNRPQQIMSLLQS